MGNRRRKLFGDKLSISSSQPFSARGRPKSKENLEPAACRSQQLTIKKERRKHLAIISFLCSILVALLLCAVHFLDHDGAYRFTGQPFHDTPSIGDYTIFQGSRQHKTPTVAHKDTDPLSLPKMSPKKIEEHDSASLKSLSQRIKEMTHRLDFMATELERAVEGFLKQAEVLDQTFEILSNETFQRSAKAYELRSHQGQASHDDTP